MIFDPSTEARALRLFLDLPTSVYRGDPHYCAAAEATVRRSLFRPSFRDRQRLFLSELDGTALARVVARLTPELRDQDGKPYGMLGFFEALDDERAAGELLLEALRWLRAQGAGEILGPMDGDTWHRYRFNVGPFERAPFLMEPYNKPYYPRLWERVGFVPLEEYHSRSVEDIAPVLVTLAPEHERVLAAGYRLRPLERSRLRQELILIRALSLRSFAGNFLYTELAQEEFLALYEGVGALLDAELVCFAHAPDGEAVAFVFAFADRFAAVAAMHGQSHLLAKLRFLRLRGAAEAVNVKTLGVLSEHRRARLSYALAYRVYRRARELGLRRANLCLIRDGNPSGKLDAGRGTILRRYTLYRLGRDPGG